MDDQQLAYRRFVRTCRSSKHSLSCKFEVGAEKGGADCATVNRERRQLL